MPGSRHRRAPNAGIPPQPRLAREPHPTNPTQHINGIGPPSLPLGDISAPAAMPGQAASGMKAMHEHGSPEPATVANLNAADVAGSPERRPKEAATTMTPSTPVLAFSSRSRRAGTRRMVLALLTVPGRSSRIDRVGASIKMQ